MKSNIEKELNKKNKRFDFRGVFKNFIAGEQEELSQKQVILNDSTLTMQEKKLLIECLENEEDRANELNIHEIVNSSERKIFGTVKNSRVSKRNTIKESNKKKDDDLIK